MASNIIAFGASRNIGYFAALRFLSTRLYHIFVLFNLINAVSDAGSRVTFLLRSPASFDDDAEIQNHVKTGMAQFVKGDALVPEDVSKAWEKATEDAPVDFILYTVGFSESFQASCSISLLTCTRDPPQPEAQNSA